MKYIEKMLLHYLWDGQLELKITGFDMERFEQIISQELKGRLESIEYIVYSDDTIISDTEKIESIKKLFQQDFYSEE